MSVRDRGPTRKWRKKLDERDGVVIHGKRMWAGLFVLAALLGPVPDAEAQSIWRTRRTDHGNLIVDTQARRVGDLITVIVAESTDVDNKDERELDRSATHTGAFNFDGEMGGGFGSKEGNLALSTSSNGGATFDGESSYSVDRRIRDRITVVVVNCLPNGNLIVRGSRNQVISGERRVLTISGVVRPIDVRPDNTIESQFVADLKVCYDGDGVESRFMRQGWLTKAWNKYRPF